MYKSVGCQLSTTSRQAKGKKNTKCIHLVVKTEPPLGAQISFSIVSWYCGLSREKHLFNIPLKVEKFATQDQGFSFN